MDRSGHKNDPQLYRRVQKDIKGAAGCERTGGVQKGARGQERCNRVQEDRTGAAVCKRTEGVQQDARGQERCSRCKRAGEVQ